MLVQLHWQERGDPSRTEFVAQGDFDSPEAVQAWAKEIVDRRQSECPAGWCPLLLEREDPRFTLAALPAV